MAIPFFEEDMEIISKLGTRPKEENGVTESELKRLFDSAGIKIKKFLNETLIPQMNMTIDVQSLLNGILDATLSKAGKAAPANIVGEKLLEIRRVAEAALSRNGGAMTGGINMNHKQLTNVPVPVNEYDAANKQYVDGRKVSATVALTTDDWVDKQQKIRNTAVTPNSIVFFSYDPESNAVASAAAVHCVAQSDGELTVSCQRIPRKTVFVNLVIWN